MGKLANENQGAGINAGMLIIVKFCVLKMYILDRYIFNTPLLLKFNNNNPHTKRPVLFLPVFPLNL